MPKVFLIEGENTGLTVGMENRRVREIDLVCLMRCKVLSEEEYKGKYTEFKFDELGKDELLQYHYLNTNRTTVLASPTLQEIFYKYAPNDVQFIPTTLIDKNGERVTGYTMMNILTEIEGHDPEYTKYEYIDYLDNGNEEIGGVKRIKYLGDAMGEHLVGRDKYFEPIIIFSERFCDILKDEGVKLKGFKYYLPEDWYND